MLPLFDAVIEDEATLPVRRLSDRFFWHCPHCGGELSQPVEEEPIAEVYADPSCCFCRAEFAGMAFHDWRRLPMETRLATKPDADWRSKRSNPKMATQ